MGYTNEEVDSGPWFDLKLWCDNNATGKKVRSGPEVNRLFEACAVGIGIAIAIAVGISIGTGIGNGIGTGISIRVAITMSLSVSVEFVGGLGGGFVFFRRWQTRRKNAVNYQTEKDPHPSDGEEPPRERKDVLRAGRMRPPELKHPRCAHDPPRQVKYRQREVRNNHGNQGGWQGRHFAHPMFAEKRICKSDDNEQRGITRDAGCALDHQPQR